MGELCGGRGGVYSETRHSGIAELAADNFRRLERL